MYIDSRGTTTTAAASRSRTRTTTACARSSTGRAAASATLRRYEVQFVEASIAFARGEPVVSDEEYEELKRKVKASGKRDDVTALLLYTKGQQLLDKDQFERLGDEMSKLDIEVGLKGATCTLSNTSPELVNDSAPC